MKHLAVWKASSCNQKKLGEAWEWGYAEALWNTSSLAHLLDREDTRAKKSDNDPFSFPLLSSFIWLVPLNISMHCHVTWIEKSHWLKVRCTHALTVIMVTMAALFWFALHLNAWNVWVPQAIKIWGAERLGTRLWVPPSFAIPTMFNYIWRKNEALRHSVKAIHKALFD